MKKRNERSLELALTTTYKDFIFMSEYLCKNESLKFFRSLLAVTRLKKAIALKAKSLFLAFWRTLTNYNKLQLHREER